MQITSVLFIFYFLPLAMASYVLSPYIIKEYILLLISLLFYAFGALDYFVLFVVSIGINVLIGRTINKFSHDNKKKKCMLALGIGYNLFILAWYKYLDFALEIVTDVLGICTERKNIALPLGISFFVFKAISYLIDIYEQKAELNANVIHDALYLSLFTQIQSGPLARYNEIRKERVSSKKIMDHIDSFSDGIYRFMIGFNKKILLSNMLYNVVDEVFATSLNKITTPYAWLGAICYTLQLYFDFSGYSDMAIGLTEMFGYRCRENFNYPYMTESIAQFWRRWHISLGNWFRDYVYIKLGGSRNEKRWYVYRNLLVVWLLTGIWHGASYNYIIWGLGYFLMISFEKITGFPTVFRKKNWKILYRVFTLLFVVVQWVIFRTQNLSFAIGYIKKMFVMSESSIANVRTLFLLKEYSVFMLIGLFLCFPIIPWIREKCQKQNVILGIFENVLAIIVIFLFVLSVSFVVSGQNNPFAYANF